MGMRRNFLVTELIIFAIIGGMTLLEIFSFGLFEVFFSNIKESSSWFVGIGFGYIFSSIFKDFFTKLFLKGIKRKNEKKGIEISGHERIPFTAFLMGFVTIALIVFFIKKASYFFLTEFFIYFHVVIALMMIFLYLIFIIKNEYKISEKHLIANGIIILINLTAIIYFVA